MSTLTPNSSTISAGKRPAKSIKLKTYLQSKGTLGSPSQRKSLQQLQPSARDNDKLVGKDGYVRNLSQKSKTPKRKREGDHEKPSKRQAKVITKPTKKFSVYQDSKKDDAMSKGENKTKKTPEEEAYELMVQEEIPEKYWEEVAEERRVALDSTLKENEQLHVEVKDLKEENTRLKVTADQAVYLADVIQDLLGEKKDDETDELKEETEDEEKRLENDRVPTDSSDEGPASEYEDSRNGCTGRLDTSDDECESDETTEDREPEENHSERLECDVTTENREPDQTNTDTEINKR